MEGCDKARLSVIVPVYRAEEYIERCARSLMEQTMKEGIEFIFINDCTPDKSMQVLERVLDDYPQRAGQVTIVNNHKNLGVSESRKKGLEFARGEYIGWCDSDDWCDAEMFERMCSVAYDGMLDIVVCDYWEIERGVTRKISVVHSDNPHEAISNLMKYRSFSGVLWNQIIKKGILKRCWDCIAPTNYSEDTYVLFHVYHMAETLKMIDAPLYYYRKDNDHSLVHVREDSGNAWSIQQENLERIEKLYYQDNGWKRFHVALNSFIFERKCLYRGAFSSNRDFFYTFRQASRDILRFYDWRKPSSWKMYLCHNCFLFFNLLNQSS